MKRKTIAARAVTLALLAGLVVACSGGVKIQSTATTSGGSGGGACGVEVPAGCGCPSGAAAPWSIRVAGEAESTQLLTTGTLPIAPDGSAVVTLGGKIVKLDAAGEVVWSRPDTWHVPPTPDPHDCSMIVAGAIPNGQTDWLGQSLTCSGMHCPLLARVDADGSLVWVKVYDFGGGGWVLPSLGGMTADGRIALVGAFEGTIDLGNGPLGAPPVPSSGVFAALLSPDGDALWSRRVVLEHTGIESVHAAVSAAGDITVTGTPAGAVDFGEGFIPEPGASWFGSLLLASYDSAGTLRFGKMIGYPSSGMGLFNIAQDSAGNLIVAGTALGPMDFGGGPVGDPDKWLTTVASFDANGQHLWSAAFGDGANVQPGLAVDPAGHVWVGTDSNTIVELGAGGAVVATHPLGGSGKRHASAIGFGPGGAPMITGTFDDTLDLGQGPLVAKGQQDAFVAVLAP